MSNTSSVLESLLTTNKDTRDRLYALFKSDQDLFTPRYDVSLREQKEIALRRLQRVSEIKTVSVKDFESNPDNIFTVHEMVIYYNTLARDCRSIIIY